MNVGIWLLAIGTVVIVTALSLLCDWIEEGE